MNKHDVEVMEEATSIELEIVKKAYIDRIGDGNGDYEDLQFLNAMRDYKLALYNWYYWELRRSYEVYDD